MFAYKKKVKKDDSKKEVALISESCIDFATWLQDNYSQNVKQGCKGMLPKGKMREDFTDNVFTISEIYHIY